jgi:hypothetical protein
MKIFKLLGLLSILLTLVFLSSCTTRSSDIPWVIGTMQKAMSNQDLGTFKYFIAADAQDKALMDSGSFSMYNLIYSAGVRYDYNFQGIDVPATGSPITVNAKNTSYKSSLSATVSSGTATFEFVNISTVPWEDNWKIKKIILPGVSTPVVKMPKFIQFTPVQQN